jgi:hypothetical protein
MNEENLKKEAEQATEMLRGKTVRVVWRHRGKEVGLEFTDGSRFFVDCTTEGAELSITAEQDIHPEGEVFVRLSQAEALVLFEFCSRFTQQGSLTIEDKAESRVLWDLTAVLERMLAEALLPEYAERLMEAREKLRDKV